METLINVARTITNPRDMVIRGPIQIEGFFILVFIGTDLIFCFALIELYLNTTFNDY